MNAGVELLRQAARHFDGPESRLAEHARRLRWRGFGGGAQWMALALGELREPPPCDLPANPPSSDLPAQPPRPLSRLRWEGFGLAKYGFALAVAVAATVPAWSLPLLLRELGALPLFVMGFYLAEAQCVFLFPLLLDGARQPLREGRRLVRLAGGSLRVAATTLRIAACMLGGGLRGGGFLRSWCLGCLAVLLWYERLRAGCVQISSITTPSPRSKAATGRTTAGPGDRPRWPTSVR